MAEFRRTDDRATARSDRSANRDQPSLFDRALPSNVDAERGLLGSILVMPRVCDDVALILRPDDFYDDANRCIYDHLFEMHDKGKRIDVTLLVDRLKASGSLETAGGLPYIAKVSRSAANAAYATQYAHVIREKSDFRNLIISCTEILEDAYETSDESKVALNRAEQKIFSVLDRRGTTEVHELQQILDDALSRIDARMKGESVGGAVETGFSDLDELTGGLHNGELVILAARPSMGKTAFAMNIAANAAIRAKAPTLFVSLEMSSAELADRLICSEARVNSHRARNGTLSKEDSQRLVDKATEVAESPFFVDDSPVRMITEVAATARRIRRKSGLSLIVIDYLQLIEPDNPRDPRQEQVSRMTRRLKGLAREMQVPILCLAQLNRQTEEAKGNRPRLNHLRESGSIEQDADVVMFVHREEYYHHGEDREQYEGQAEIIVAKQRNGPVGDIALTWVKEYTRFENAARRNDFPGFNEPTGGEF